MAMNRGSGEKRMASTNGRASLADVAKLAGVSAGTVSRALSRPEMISDATVARVRQAADQLDYVANGSARSLAVNRTMTIGAIVPRFGTSQFSIMVQALESQLAADGYTLLLASPEHSDAREPQILRTLLERGVDAVALLGSQHPEQTFSLLKAHRTPFVLMWGEAAGRSDVVGFDEHEAADLVIEHLYQLGHRTIAFVGGRTVANERALMRRKAVSEATRSREMILPRDAVVETEYGFREGYDAVRGLLDGSREFTAVVLGNDYLAAGAVAVLGEHGVRVPEELSVVSFNDNDFAAFLRPSLTTVRLPIAAIGQEAARYLVGKLGDAPTRAPTRLPVELIVRASTGPRSAR